MAQIHEYKGKQEGYAQQKPVELQRLVEIARIQSTESSNRIEGIVTTNARLKQLVQDKTTPGNRAEAEILEYRNALNIIHESYEAIPIRSNYILQLHGELLKHTAFSLRVSVFPLKTGRKQGKDVRMSVIIPLFMCVQGGVYFALIPGTLSFYETQNESNINFRLIRMRRKTKCVASGVRIIYNRYIKCGSGSYSR